MQRRQNRSALAHRCPSLLDPKWLASDGATAVAKASIDKYYQSYQVTGDRDSRVFLYAALLRPPQLKGTAGLREKAVISAEQSARNATLVRLSQCPALPITTEAQAPARSALTERYEKTLRFD
jgi:hypothetical protein